jgi:ABC-2 type transport system ATP-binding protein
MKKNTENNIIKTENLSKRFGKRIAINKVNFQVKEGEIMGITGQSGAGKSILMKLLCGLVRPSEGEAIVYGVNICRFAEQVKKDVAYMNQDFSLYEDLTVNENLTLFGGIYKMPESQIREKTTLLLQEFDMTKERNTLVKSLSYSNKQKVAFMTSIFSEPKILFLDEPTNGVDLFTRRQFWKQIFKLSSKGTTVLFATQYMDEAAYCDRVALLAHGEIKNCDKPIQLMKDYGVATMHDVFLQFIKNQSV